MRKKKKTAEQYTFLSLCVGKYSAGVDASINHKARDPRHCDDDVRIYRFSSTLEIEGICIDPKERTGETYRITVYGREPGERDLVTRLTDCHVRDENGEPKYRKLRGQSAPVYDIPKGLGLLQKECSTKNWNGWLWVPEQTVTQMLTLVTTVRPLYGHIHERKVDRTRWIYGFTLQTTDPAKE